ncbi:MAG: RagB/SusD family nutrient uptake outer membrane protein [Bacteroidales bacterium]|nr:RagB/SusD family nutrient uptake outer membrane protein [Bacteroidales bacterium]
MKSIKFVGFFTLLSLCFAACEKDYLDTMPTAQVSTATVFETTENAKMAVNGIARLMVMQQLSTQTQCGEGTIKYLHGEYFGENFSRPALASGWYTVMNATTHESSTSLYAYYPWYYYYMLMGNANTIIDNIDNARGPDTEKQFIKAQALTYRAYCYTMLVQFYCYRWADSNNGTSVTNLMDGLVLRTEENISETDIPLSASGEIYRQIYSDLDQAIDLFQKSGLTRGKIWEPNINVAYATYARAAITRQDYTKAAEMAPRARQGFALMTNTEYFAGFAAPNSEWIWGSYGGEDQTLYFYGFHSYMAFDAETSIIRTYPVCISKTLYERIPDTDIRRNLFLDPGTTAYNTVGTIPTTDPLAIATRAAHPPMTSAFVIAAYMAFKFSIKGSIGVGYINHFRSSEMILIEAEANYYNNNFTAAQNLLNTLTRDSGRDPAYTCTATGADLLREIKFYRAVELWGEGFDWFDKKRYNEPIVRLGFNNGGNFGAPTDVTRPVDYGNRWTNVTPLIEREQNKAIGDPNWKP